MKNVKIGYMRLASIFCLGNLIHFWVGSQILDFLFFSKTSPIALTYQNHQP
jgi:hypothetical protein